MKSKLLFSFLIALVFQTKVNAQCSMCKAVIEANLKPYDILPLIPIIKNSGAIVTNWSNEPAEKGGNILATSNKKLHNKILKLLKPFVKK